MPKSRLIGILSGEIYRARNTTTDDLDFEVILKEIENTFERRHSRAKKGEQISVAHLINFFSVILSYRTFDSENYPKKGVKYFFL
jgi:hypothetical protein